MCLIYIIIALQTFIRLQKFGICMSHKFVRRIITLFEDGYDDAVKRWKSESEKDTLPPKYILVGDNVDKNVSPRFMRLGHQVQSIHAWHSYAVADRYDTDEASKEEMLRDLNSVCVADYLPSVQDTVQLREHYIVLCTRVLVSRLPFLNGFSDDIRHNLSKEMSKKSNVVS